MRLVEVVPKVYVGDIESCREDELKRCHISHVLSVMDEVASMKERLFQAFTHKNVGISENPPNNFLPRLSECLTFLNEGVAARGVVVVSWLGMSRNVAVVIAYLMKSRTLTLEDASAKVRGTGYVYAINDNLVSQLKLFEKMKCTVDEQAKVYTTWRTKASADHAAYLDKVASTQAIDIANSRQAQHLSTILMQRAGGSVEPESFAPDPENEKNPKSDIFACSLCKRKLFTAQNAIVHAKTKDPLDIEEWECAYMFCEPMAWMKGDVSKPTGKFACPSCGVLTGEWSWEGALCSCHVKVKPSFRIHKAKLVRLSPAGQIVQAGGSGWKKAVWVSDSSSAKKTSPRNKPLTQLFGRKRKEDGERPAPRISSASELDRVSKHKPAESTPPAKPASDEMLGSSAKGIPLDAHQRKMERKARRAHAKTVARQHRREERAKRKAEAEARGEKGPEEEEEDEDEEEEEEDDDDDDDDDEEEEEEGSGSRPALDASGSLPRLSDADSEPTAGSDNAESGDTAKGDMTKSAPDLNEKAAGSSGSDKGDKEKRHHRHHHHHQHRRHSSGHKSRSAARKGGEEPRQATTFMGKVLDKFKKKDKTAAKLAYNYEKEGMEAEEAQARKHLPPVYLTCVDDLPKDMRKIFKSSKITDAEVKDNFTILLHCLHFLTKRSFVYTPKDVDPITIGRTKSKERKPKTDLPPAETLLTEGVVKKDLKVQEVVGEGGFGRVYMAKNLKGKGRVAVKKMKHVNPRDQYRNLSEVNFLKRVDHPNIVKYISSYTVNDELWVVTEFMEGGTLTQALKGFEFQEKQIAFVAKEMLQGIHYLHQNHLIHRDLKSANIMMTTQGDVKLIDFGLCMDYATQGDKRCHMVGSPFWMPPEMIKRQNYSYPVDIWSFAICLLELANGQPPNRKSALKAMFTAGTEGYPRPFKNPAQWTRDFKDFIGRCLEVDPEQRATAADLLEHPFLGKADTRKGMKKILSHIFLQNTMEMMNLGGI